MLDLTGEVLDIEKAVNLSKLQGPHLLKMNSGLV